MTLQEQVKTWFKRGVSVSAFCSSIGITTVMLYDWLNRGAELPDDTIKKIEQYLDRL